MGRLWRVVGGEKGGLLVRDGRELASAEKEERLASQSILEEVEIAGSRLHYCLYRGSGPASGWISMKLKDRQLVWPADTRETGKKFEGKAPVPELLLVQASEKHGTLRNVQSSLDDLEQKALSLAKDASRVKTTDMAPFETVVEDLLYHAWKRENRKRVLLFLAQLLQSCVKNSWDRAANVVCHELCLVSWASSMVDVEYYAPLHAQSPVVVICGFGGSHLDDLQPAIEHWTLVGAAVLAFGPARVGRQDILDVVFEKLMTVIEGRSVILHFFSDGGFGMARSLLAMWEESWRAKEVGISPSEAVKCMISDGAGLLPHEVISVSEESTDETDPIGPGRSEADADKATTNTALAFFTGCGLNMLMTFGACEAFHEEPANSFGKALVSSANSGRLGSRLASAPRGPMGMLWRVFRELPTLLVASKGDKVVPLERSLSLATWLRELPNRVLTQAQRWADASILGQDGTSVRVLTLDKALHCRAMVSHADQYWEAVDALVADCVPGALGE